MNDKAVANVAVLHAEYIKVSKELASALHRVIPTAGCAELDDVLRLHLRCARILQAIAEVSLPEEAAADALADTAPRRQLPQQALD